eukprot:8951043-Alexandrium_andersonii.AAC.1
MSSAVSSACMLTWVTAPPIALLRRLRASIPCPVACALVRSGPSTLRLRSLDGWGGGSRRGA